VYCLIRESWGRITGEFDIDHFVPQTLRPDWPHEYDNLLYSCHVCNLRKGNRDVPQPSATLTAATVRLYPDGSMIGVSPDADRLIRILCLNSVMMKRWRRTWMRIIELATESDRTLLNSLMGYPDDMPDLSASRPPENTRPDGVAQSCFARQRRGELAEMYEC
jgi:hypothetical protein